MYTTRVNNDNFTELVVFYRVRQWSSLHLPLFNKSRPRDWCGRWMAVLVMMGRRHGLGPVLVLDLASWSMVVARLVVVTLVTRLDGGG